MSPSLRRAALLALLVALSAAVAPVFATATYASEPASSSVRGVVLILVPDLRWTDLASMPRLRQFEAAADVGVLSVRAEGAATRCGDGLLELSAGTRVPTGVRECTVDAARLASLRPRYRHDRFGARIGTLGDLLGPRGYAVGAAAATAMAARDGSSRVVASVADAFARDPAPVVAVVDDALYAGHDRVTHAAATDAAIAQQLAQVPTGARVIVAGCSDGPAGQARLHPLFVGGPGATHRELRSPTTGRAPYVQLFDLTASLVDEGRLPRYVSGRAITTSGHAARAPSSYADLDRHARRALSVGHPTFTVLCAVLLGCLLLALARPSVAASVAPLLVLAPAGAWSVQLLPWWRWNTVAYVACVAAVAVVGGAAVFALRRRRPVAALLLGPALTALLLVADQLAGAPLQLAAPFGDNPLVAGRFHGMGNIDFGVAMTSLLMCGVAAASAARTRRSAVAFAVVFSVVAIVIDGAPMLGDDLGGVLALVPACCLFIAIVAGVRVTARRVVATVAAAVLIAAAVAVLDYQRPASQRTHAGRFVGQVLHGGAWQEVHRKLDAVLGSFGNPIVTALVLVALAALVVLRSRAARATTDVVVARAAIVIGALAVIGSAVNDSGVFVAAAATLAFAPSALSVVAGDNQAL